MIKIKRKGNFEAMLEELVESDFDLNELIKSKIKIFSKNPEDTRLDNHALTGKMEGKFAFSITDNIRIVYRWIGKSSVRFLNIGYHKNVYL